MSKIILVEVITNILRDIISTLSNIHFVILEGSHGDGSTVTFQYPSECFWVVTKLLNHIVLK